jgi:hypothetical protein
MEALQGSIIGLLIFVPPNVVLLLDPPQFILKPLDDPVGILNLHEVFVGLLAGLHETFLEF